MCALFRLILQMQNMYISINTLDSCKRKCSYPSVDKSILLFIYVGLAAELQPLSYN